MKDAELGYTLDAIKKKQGRCRTTGVYRTYSVMYKLNSDPRERVYWILCEEAGNRQCMFKVLVKKSASEGWVLDMGSSRKQRSGLNNKREDIVRVGGE